MRRLIVNGLLALAALGVFSSAAYAADYSGSCADVPGSVTGSIYLTDIDCTIDHPITATGDIRFEQFRQTISTKGMTAGGNIYSEVESKIEVDGDVIADGYVYLQSEGKISINGDVTTNIAGSITLIADQNVSVNNVSSAPNSHVIIYANKTEQYTEKFFIGGSGHLNGINGTATSQDGAVWIQNGDGGIKVVDSTKINALAVLLDANDGEIEIPSGALSAGTNNDGQIHLMSKTINFASGATLSVGNSGLAGHGHGISLNAETVNYKGDGLTVRVDGDGNSSGSKDAFIYLLPQNGTVILKDGVFNPYLDINNQVAASGANMYYKTTDAAPLKIETTGSFSNIEAKVLHAYFEGAGDITITSKGSERNGVYLRNKEILSNDDGFVFSGGAGKVLLEASSETGNTSNVEISSSYLSFDKERFDVKADGASNGDGNAGTIWISSSKLTQNETMSKFSASGNGSGNGGVILVKPGNSDFFIGENLNDPLAGGSAQLEAQSGSDGGNGGAIYVNTIVGNVIISGSQSDDGSNSVNVSAKGNEGNGGVIQFDVDGNITFQPKLSETSAGLNANAGLLKGTGGTVQISANAIEGTGVSVHFSANGIDDGAGGLVSVSVKESMDVAFALGTMSFEARNVDPNLNWLNGNGDGGTVILKSEKKLSLYGAAVSVDGGLKGGTLSFEGDEISLTGNFFANGGAQGNGGIIRMTAQKLTGQNAGEDSLVVASGNGEGAGGLIDLNINGTEPMQLGGESNVVDLSAQGGDTGNGGEVKIKTGGDLTVDGSFIKVGSGGPGWSGSGKGGKISLESGGKLVTTGTLDANGGCNAEGGEISLKADQAEIAIISASAGSSASCSQFNQEIQNK